MNQQMLISRFQAVRQYTVNICSQLELEDYVVQPHAEVSPPKWHLAHVTWFFETVILKQFKADYAPFDEQFNQLFNSYYKAVGAHTIQSERGNLSRPTVKTIMAYREYVDQAMHALLSETQSSPEVIKLIETGLHHEQQHQELLLMDIKRILANNVVPTQYSTKPLSVAFATSESWTNFTEGLYEIGHQDEGFYYDNEAPRHQHYLYPFSISDTLITNAEFLAFIEAGGYQKATYWLSQGWDWVEQEKITQPLYWFKHNEKWQEYTLHGLIPLDLDRPVVHISYFEAIAYANWRGLRLPTEQELEVFLAKKTIVNHDIDEPILHPNDAQAANGQVWCWTNSQYLPYPGFKPFDGLLNEYNGKFMCNQFVLRGGCIATPNQHYRHSYRNFYLPHQRWMFSGIRLAKDHI